MPRARHPDTGELLVDAISLCGYPAEFRARLGDSYHDARQLARYVCSATEPVHPYTRHPLEPRDLCEIGRLLGPDHPLAPEYARASAARQHTLLNDKIVCVAGVAFAHLFLDAVGHMARLTRSQETVEDAVASFLGDFETHRGLIGAAYHRASICFEARMRETLRLVLGGTLEAKAAHLETDQGKGLERVDAVTKRAFTDLAYVMTLYLVDRVEAAAATPASSSPP